MENCIYNENKILKGSKNIFSTESFHHYKQHGFIRSVEDVILTKIVHTAGGTKVV